VAGVASPDHASAPGFVGLFFISHRPPLINQI
jgi:hypothetical protein